MFLAWLFSKKPTTSFAPGRNGPRRPICRSGNTWPANTIRPWRSACRWGWSCI